MKRDEGMVLVLQYSWSEGRVILIFRKGDETIFFVKGI